MLVSDILARGRAQHPNKLAIVSEHVSRTYSELADRVEHIAGALAAAGMRPRDRMAILAANDPGVVEVCLAASMIGAVVVPLNPRVTADDIAFQARRRRCRLRLRAGRTRTARARRWPARPSIMVFGRRSGKARRLGAAVPRCPPAIRRCPGSALHLGHDGTAEGLSADPPWVAVECQRLGTRDGHVEPRRGLGAATTVPRRWGALPVHHAGHGRHLCGRRTRGRGAVLGRDPGAIGHGRDAVSQPVRPRRAP